MFNRRGLLSDLLIVIATVVMLLAGAQSAQLGTALQAHDPGAEQILAQFRGLERNATTTFRWSLPRSNLYLAGYERSQILLRMRLASPRPPDAPPALLSLQRGPWASASWLVHSDWRTYQLLLPAHHDGTQLYLSVPTFRPDGSERLGVALSDLSVTPADSSSTSLIALGILGPWLLVLLILPMLVWRILIRVFQARIVALSGIVLSLCAVLLAARFPVTTAGLLPDTWLAQTGAGIVLLILYAWKIPLQYLRMLVVSVFNHDQRRLAFLLGSAIIQGLLFLVLVPPWQHYDEPAHFEFAWLIANLPTWPTPGTTDPRISWIGGEARATFHQPLYHIIVSIPLRFVTTWPIEHQLYVARCVSVVCFVLSIAIAWQSINDLTRPGNSLRWAVPLGMLLLPTYADMMTAVNNDVGAALAGSAFFGASIRLIRDGPVWHRVVYVFGAALIGALIKNTAGILLVLAVVAFITSLAVRYPSRRRWGIALLSIGVIGSVAASLVPGEAARWYRWGQTTTAPTLLRSDPASASSSIVALQGTPVQYLEGFSNPLHASDLQAVAGQTITYGAWVWASRPVQAWGPGLLTSDRVTPYIFEQHTISLTTEPVFIAHSYVVPRTIGTLQYMAWAVVPEMREPVTLYYRAPILVVGAFPLTEAPQFTNSTLMQGFWGGQPFNNLIRNPTLLETTFGLRPAVETLTSTYVRSSTSRIVAALFDFQRSGPILVQNTLFLMYSAVATFGWSQVTVNGVAWLYVFPLLLLLLWGTTIMRCVWPDCQHMVYQQPIFFFLVGSSAVIWTIVILRVLPALQLSPPPFARYGWTAILPSMIVLLGSWLRLWPVRRQEQAAGLAIGAILTLNLIGLQTIHRFYDSSCATRTEACGFTPLPALDQQPIFPLLLVAALILGMLLAWYQHRRQPFR